MAIPHHFQWNDGAPVQLKPGMIVQWDDHTISLIGDYDDEMCCIIPTMPPHSKEIDIVVAHITRWAWAIKPSELEWAQSMATRR